MSSSTNYITITSSSLVSPPAAGASHIGTQISTSTLRERRGVTWFIQIESCILVGDHHDKGLAQPKGHLQPTVMNVPRRRRAPVKAAPIYIPTPLSSPCTPFSPAAYLQGTQNHLRTPCEGTGDTVRVHCNRTKIEEWRRGVMSPEGQLVDPLMTGEGLWEVPSSSTFVTTPLLSPCMPPSDSSDSDVGLIGGRSRSRTLRERRGVTFFIQLDARELSGWYKKRGPQPKGHLEPTVLNLPRRHKREIYGPMIHSSLPCNFY